MHIPGSNPNDQPSHTFPPASAPLSIPNGALSIGRAVPPIQPPQVLGTPTENSSAQTLTSQVKPGLDVTPGMNSHPDAPEVPNGWTALWDPLNKSWDFKTNDRKILTNLMPHVAQTPGQMAIPVQASTVQKDPNHVLPVQLVPVQAINGAPQKNLEV